MIDNHTKKTLVVKLENIQSNLFEIRTPTFPSAETDIPDLWSAIDTLKDELDKTIDILKRVIDADD